MKPKIGDSVIVEGADGPCMRVTNIIGDEAAVIYFGAGQWRYTKLPIEWLQVIEREEMTE